MQFEWPDDLEECVHDLARAHVRGGLKRRTWDALHAELLAKVPPPAPKRYSLQDLPHQLRMQLSNYAVHDYIDYSHSQISIVYSSSGRMGIGRYPTGQLGELGPSV